MADILGGNGEQCQELVRVHLLSTRSRDFPVGSRCDLFVTSVLNLTNLVTIRFSGNIGGGDEESTPPVRLFQIILATVNFRWGDKLENDREVTD